VLADVALETKRFKMQENIPPLVIRNTV
jgi:hypothetical protein